MGELPRQPRLAREILKLAPSGDGDESASTASSCMWRRERRKVERGGIYNRPPAWVIADRNTSRLIGK